MKDKIKVLITITIFSLIILLQSCTNDYPPSLFNPNEKFNPDPQITAIQPDSAFAGVDTLTITGKNFSTVVEENDVYFNGEKGTVLSSTATSLRVVPANVISDSIKIQVHVKGALKFAEYSPYKLQPIFVEIGGFDDYDDPYGIAVDKDENIYVSLNGQPVQKIARDGSVSDYSKLIRGLATHMRWASDDGIYYVFGLKYLLKIKPGGGGDALFAVLPGGAFDLDLDQDGNVYCGGGGNAIYRVAPNKSVKTVKKYPEIYISAVRIFNGYVYVAGKYTGTDTTHIMNGIWRNEILTGVDSLGATELVLNFDKYFVGNQVMAIAFSQDGEMLIGTDQAEGILVLHKNGSLTPLYPGILGPDIYTIVWGNGNYIYVTRKNTDVSKRRVLKINTREKGAPYYGRK
jgi:hypothetical protein